MKFIKNTQERLKRASNVNLLVEQVSFIKKIAVGLFKINRSDRTDTFEDLSNLGVSAEKVQEARQAFKRLFTLFLIISGLILLYFFYSLIEGNFFTAVIALAVFAMCLSQSFKYHFWFVQIEKKKLGCSFSEWLDYTLRAMKLRKDKTA
jgi:intracellular multiplication protein IcmV